MNNQEQKKIIGKVFPNELPSLEELESRYPLRGLPEGALVTRFGPSPTGVMHIGGVYTALICERMAHLTKGVFYLRIEDTDKEREIAGSLEKITDAFHFFNIPYNEGRDIKGDDFGAYGPYRQSERVEIYHSCVKYLLENDLAYLCFSSKEDLAQMREKQEREKIRPGCYGEWAPWRNKRADEVLEMLEKDEPYVVRLKSDGDINRKVKVKDLVLGERELPENDQDIVLMKSDGLPTYHLAHVADDHFMRTTHVVRGNEWLSSLPVHLQIFKMMGWKTPRYAHIFPIQKLDEGSKRKLSKRKDPEADVVYYKKEGYPPEAVLEYLLNLSNSNFEDWRRNNPEKKLTDFPFSVKKLSGSSGPLLDINKLNDISKDVIAKYSAEGVYSKTLFWAERYETDFYNLLAENEDYMKKILSIERDNCIKRRKDIAKWSQVEEEVSYFFDDRFVIEDEQIKSLLEGISSGDAQKIVKLFQERYDEKDDQKSWFENIKQIAKECGYADNMKEFKQNPEKFKGSVIDVTKVFRVLLTGKTQTPDLYSVMQVMGKERVFKRLDKISRL